MSALDTYDSLHDLVENFGFATYFSHLMKTKKYVDVTFILEADEGEVKLFAHQLVLAMRSAYFADMFYGEQKKKGNKTVRFEKVNAKAFEDLVRYCYGCKPYFEATEEITTLFKVAYEFKVMSLVDLCRTMLMGMELAPENAFNMLKLSEYTEDKKLKNVCYKFLEENTKHVMESYKLAEVTPAMVHVILDLPKLSLNSEFELIKWLIDWANAKVQEGDAVCVNAKEYLKNFLKYMNFLALNFEEFAKLCKDYPDFFNSEEIASIYVNISYSRGRKMPEWYNNEMKTRKYIGHELREKTEEKNFRTIQKHKANTLAKKEGLTQLMEVISNIEKRLKDSRMEMVKWFFKNYRAFNHLKASTEMRKRLKEILGKDEKLDTCKEEEELIQEAADQLQRMQEILEGDKEFTTMKEMLENDEEYEKMKTLLEICEEFERISEILENDENEKQRIEEVLENSEEGFEIISEILENDEKEKQRIEEVLENSEEGFERISKILEKDEKQKQKIEEVLENSEEGFERMRELLENGENICSIYKDFKSINESLKDLYSEVNQELIKI